MSHRVKRPNRSEDGTVPVKRRKRPTTAQEEEEASPLASWRPINDLKIYNRTTTEAPAELFRKDLISAMKLPDSEPLATHEYWVINDQWKQEWERGVQVPVNPDSLPEPTVTVTHCVSVQSKSCPEFKPPKTRYIRITKDDRFKPEDHYLSTAPAQAEAACSYDLDECDVAWMKAVNAERLALGLSPLTEDQLERVMERLELRCWDKIQAILRNEEGLGIEYDENVICDVCRSPDSEEGNEMVFCDSCNICVHQACYGITRIPEGQWLCCTCQIKQRPDCVLCPNKGGAMKSTRSGQKWAHVSCALWIPEVSIGCVERMEPITKISSIPQSRWALICVLCRERVGSCIQCSVKTCKTAYHVTCAFKHGLEMRAIIEDENADDGVKLRSYCEKHSKSSKKEKERSAAHSSSEDDDSKRKKRKDMTSEEKNQARAVRLQEIEAEFFKQVAPSDIAVHIDVDAEALQCIYNYWKLKRKARFNKPLLPPKCDDVDMLSHNKEQDKEKMKKFVQLRQDLERVRNLCYMVSRREKLSRTYFKLRESTFQKQCAVLQEANLPTRTVQAVLLANRVPSFYDRIYSNQQGDQTIKLDRLLTRIVGVKSPPESGDESKRTEINGVIFKDVKNNPYKKVYFNGSSKRRSASLYGSGLSSTSNSDDDKPKLKHNKENRLSSCSEDEKPPLKKRTPNKSSKVLERRRKRLSIADRYDSSSEEDVKHTKKENSNSRLKQIEKELGMSATDSDELMPIRSSSGARSSPNKKATITSIYSDSSDSSSSCSSRNDNASDSQSQSKMRTKAAVKDFSHKPSTSKSPNKSSPENKKKSKEEGRKDKKKDYVPSDLIVPQRQAAKKATENLKSTTSNRTTKEAANETEIIKPVPVVEEKEKPPPSSKPRKIGRPPKERKEESEKKKEVSKIKDDVFDIDKELDKSDPDILAYVPQRQAAKKAAEHIKGLGKPGAVVEEDKKSGGVIAKDVADKKEDSKKTKDASGEKAPAKVSSDSKRRSSSNSSVSSSSSSSSDSSSSSSSESADERTTSKKESLFNEVPQPQQQQQQHQPHQQQQNRRNKTGGTKDWPFLDKAAQSAASSSSSDSSDSSRASSPRVRSGASKSPRGGRSSSKPGRKATVDKRTTPPEREESARARGKGRPGRGRPRSANASDSLGDVHVRTGDNVERRNEGGEPRGHKVGRKGKSIELGDQETTSRSGTAKKLFSPFREAEKKVMSPEKVASKAADSELGDLEKEILERKAATNKPSKSKFDRLFGSPEVKLNKSTAEKLDKSPVKENKEPSTGSLTPKRSPSKTIKSIDDIFSNKISNSLMSKSPDRPPKKDAPSTNKLVEPLQIMNKSEDFPKFDDVKPSAIARSIHQSNDDFLDHIDIDILDDGFGGLPKDDEISKLPLSFNISSSMMFKEDSKEDSARETLNLVEKLRGNMGLKNSYDIEDSLSVASSKNEDRLEFPESISSTNHHKDEKLDAPPAVEPSKYDNQPNVEAKCVPEVQHQHLDVTAQADERWVPPSSESYPNMQAVDHKIFSNESMVPFGSETTQRVLSSSQEKSPLQDGRVTRASFLDTASSMDCLPSPMPYNDIHPQAKWADSHVMPNRRSSTSSVASSTSNLSSRRNVEDEESAKARQEPTFIPNHNPLEAIPILPQFPPNSMDAFAQFAESQLVNAPVSLFPPNPSVTQLPFPSPGAAMFPPPFGASYPAPPTVISPHVKPPDETPHIPQSAAFTSSRHNMALTAAMVNLQTAFAAKPAEEAAEVLSTPEHAPMSSPALSQAATPNHIEPSPNPSIKSNSSSGKKSPSKPTRTSARFVSQQKSPSKSPGKSPRQEILKPAKRDGKKVGKSNSSGRGTQSQSRGRGRGRGRGRPPHLSHDYDINTIHNKLVGTVYDLDFDDDMSSSDPGDLRAMRERRKSADVHDRKDESPKFTSSPSQKSSRYSDLSELRPPTPIDSAQSKPATPVHQNEQKTFPAVVAPVLPGPVDMRTYNNTFDAQPYNDSALLGAFATGTTEAPAHEDLDEDLEKAFHSALTASLSKKEEVPELNKIKVSLSDSRNQLKVKIKGPISNYTCTPTVAPLPTVSETTSTSLQTNSIISNISNMTNMPVSSNSGNLHRMRKKELLRQYCSQGMDDSINSAISSTPVTPSLNRTIITIPKAVASMTSIPTKDDYRDYRLGGDDLSETKGRKDKNSRSGMTHGDGDDDERRRGLSNNGTTATIETIKRRGRPPRPSSQGAQVSVTPKLKIKISGGNHVVGGPNTILPASSESSKMDSERRDRIRPPKKRLSAVAKPSVEDLKRESMKFRRQVMADFDVKKEKKKKDKSNRKSKKKKKQDLQVVATAAAEEHAKPKLIIRFKKNDENDAAASAKKDNIAAEKQAASAATVKVDERTVSGTGGAKNLQAGSECGAGTSGKTDGGGKSAVTVENRTGNSNSTTSGNSSNNNGQQQQLQQQPTVTPIKLKLARCQEGSGYVMKSHHEEQEGGGQQALNLHAEPPPSAPVHAPLPLNKDCEVR